MLLRRNRNGRLVEHITRPTRLKVYFLFCNVDKGSYTLRLECTNDTGIYVVRNWLVEKLQVVVIPFLLLIILLLTFS